MTFDEKKKEAFDAVEAVSYGIHCVTHGMVDIRAACNVIEGLLRAAIDELDEVSFVNDRELVLRRMRIVRLLYYDLAAKAKLIPKEMAYVRQRCYRMAMAIDDLVYA